MVADGIVTTGDAVPYSFGGQSLLASKPLPTSLGGLTVQVTDSKGTVFDAGLYSVTPTEINWEMPDGVSEGPAVVKVYQGGAEAFSEIVTVAHAVPGIFTVDRTGSGTPVAMVLTIDINGRDTLTCLNSPIDLKTDKDQVFLVLCGTGFRHNQKPVSATIDGQPVDVYYTGSVPDYQGLDQVNLLIPRSLKGKGDVPVVITYGDASTNTVTVNIK